MVGDIAPMITLYDVDVCVIRSELIRCHRTSSWGVYTVNMAMSRSEIKLRRISMRSDGHVMFTFNAHFNFREQNTKTSTMNHSKYYTLKLYYMSRVLWVERQMSSSHHVPRFDNSSGLDLQTHVKSLYMANPVMSGFLHHRSFPKVKSVLIAD